MKNKRITVTTLLLSMFFTATIAQTVETVEFDYTTIDLEEITITSQYGNQHLLDIPVAITAISAPTLESGNISGLEQLAGYVPGFNALVQTPGRPNLVIRGLTSDEVSPSAQPRVSVYLNHAPISRATMAIAEIYDMERVEVLKGPQGTLFGRGSQAGAIHYITRKPENLFGGYVKAGMGDFGMMQFEGAVNVPITQDISARLAGIYSYRDGYIKNLSGGDALNGKNTFGGRFSVAYAPQNSNFKADLMVNYQKDDNPGTGFINPNNVHDIFDYGARVDPNTEFYNRREVFGYVVNARYYVNENNYFSAINSYFSNTANSRFDGDGTSGAAIDMLEKGKANQFMQEFRFNFSAGNRLSGITGASFWREDVSHTYDFRPNEQYAAWLIFEMPKMLMHGNRMRFQAAMPHLGINEDLHFSSDHEEVNVTNATNSAFDLYFDATYKLTAKLSFTAGVRATFEKFAIKNHAYHSAGEPSVIGQWFVFSDNDREPSFFVNEPNREAVNFFFYPVNNPREEKSYAALTWRTNLKYDLDERSNVFAGYSRGRRPNVFQYNSVGDLSIIDAESLHSFDAGYKLVSRRYMFDVSLYYQLYNNFQSSMWEGMNYIIVDGGKATSYGVEISGRAMLNSYLNIFGNYAYARATFDDSDNVGAPQAMAGRTLRLTPRNSFLVGLNVGVDILQNMRVTLTPAYSWRSHFYFEDANDPEIEQDAYGSLNANLSLLFKQQRLTVSVFGSNITGEKYLIGAGNMGAMFGIPTFVPGPPRMIGGKIMWRFK